MRRRDWFATLCVWTIAGLLAAAAATQSLNRYHEFRSGWAWDLAYNNQWFWALVQGDQKLSVRPINAWGNEGPSIWVRTHLDPIRLLAVPFYAAWPDPRTLLVFHCVVVWMLLPAAYGLVWQESGSLLLAISAAAMVPLTPLVWPTAWNDFREMALGLPFVLWAIQGFRALCPWLTALGLIGMLLSREEYGVMVASMAILPPRREEDIGQTYRWARTVLLVGTAWVILVFFGYESLLVSRLAPEQYVAHFSGAKPSLPHRLGLIAEFLVLGMGAWSLFALAAPRVAVLAVPWTWALSGRWKLALLSDWRWHHVRYTTPMVATVLAAGLVGYALFGKWALAKQGRRWLLASVWVLSMGWCAWATWVVTNRVQSVEKSVAAEDVEALWSWIERVGPDEGVLASYEVSAPLSSRRWLYSTELESNKPRGFPKLGPEIHWVFLPESELPEDKLVRQGFERVFKGRSISVHRRTRVAGGAVDAG